MTTRADPPSPSATDDAALGAPESPGASAPPTERRGSDELGQALREAELLNAVTADAAGEEDLGRILAVALERLQGVIPFTGGSIALLERAAGGEGDGEDGNDELVIRAAVGPFAETALGQRSRRGAGRLWPLIDTGEPLLSGNVVADGLRRTSPFLSFLAVPLTPSSVI